MEVGWGPRLGDPSNDLLTLNLLSRHSKKEEEEQVKSHVCLVGRFLTTDGWQVWCWTLLWEKGLWHWSSLHGVCDDFIVKGGILHKTFIFVQHMFRAHICHKYQNLSCEEISDFYKEFEQFMEFYRNLCRFCSKFVCRKICWENLCGEKMTNMRCAYGEATVAKVYCLTNPKQSLLCHLPCSWNRRVVDLLWQGRQHCCLSICGYWLSLTNTLTEDKIQITLLILRRCLVYDRVLFYHGVLKKISSIEESL